MSQEFDDEVQRLIKEKENGQYDTAPVKLGKASSVIAAEEAKELAKSVVEDIGWIRVKLETLPSQGIFYPTGTEITIRAAAAGEIRHWSTLDEEDLLSLDDALNRVADRCCKIKFPRLFGSFKDLKEIDRFFIIFAIREYTFKKGENNLNVTFNCKKCGKIETVTITKEMVSYYTPAPELQSRFSEDERCFHLRLSNGEEIKLYLPTLGVMSYIKSYITDKNKKGEEFDQAFLKWAPFLFPEWRTLNDASYQKALQDSYMWSLDKISVLDWFVDQMQKTVKAELKKECSTCGAEVTAQLTFPGGVKSLFLISDISSKLL